jgi:acyl phosphate:glycerol-3-phosphate acyltransferase
VSPEALNTYWWIPLAAYAIGSIPFGYLILRQSGQGDIRSVGSGNVGATNVARAAGIGAGAFTFLLDAAKGAFAVWLAAQITGGALTWMIAAALGAMLGHIFPVWLAGRGGRGVSTAVGAYLLICWPAVIATIVIWLAVMAVSRYVSLASIMAAAALPFLMYLLYAPGHAPSYIVSGGTTFASLMIILKHRANIARLMNGTENRFTFHRSPRGQQN